MGSPEPWEVAPEVFCLGPQGFTQTNIYFVGAASDWFLVDCGWASDGPRIGEAANSLFGADSPPKAILLTHYHPDHAGPARNLALAWNCSVYLHPLELPLASGDLAAMTQYAGPQDRWVVLPLMRAMGKRRRDEILSRSSLADVAGELESHGVVPGLGGWRWILTPGHTPGHVAFFREADRVLISGDALVNLQLNSLWGLMRQRPGLSGPPWYTTWNRRAARESIFRLAALEPAVVAGGHGTPRTDLATAADVAAFAERLGRSS